MLVTPTLLDDMHKRMGSWGTEGKINPFREIYDVGFFNYFIIFISSSIMILPV
jgi:hypothetical protein